MHPGGMQAHATATEERLRAALAERDRQLRETRAERDELLEQLLRTRRVVRTLTGEREEPMG